MTTAADGQFSVNVEPGSYVLEMVGDRGLVIATSAFISAAAGATTTGDIVAGGPVQSGAAAPTPTATAILPQATLSQTVPDASRGSLNGIVMTPDAQLLANVAVRARNPVTEEIGGSTTTLPGGQFAIDVAPGRYVLEIVDAARGVVGRSAVISAAAGATVTRALVASGPVSPVVPVSPVAAAPTARALPTTGEVADGPAAPRVAAQETAATATPAILEETVLDASRGVISGIVTNPGRRQRREHFPRRQRFPKARRHRSLHAGRQRLRTDGSHQRRRLGHHLREVAGGQPAATCRHGPRPVRRRRTRRNEYQSEHRGGADLRAQHRRADHRRGGPRRRVHGDGGRRVRIVPTVNSKRATPHTEAFQVVILHLLVSHPLVKVGQTKWESMP